jgi:glycosyltransferase involved in cell wall biosynthesis
VSPAPVLLADSEPVEAALSDPDRRDIAIRSAGAEIPDGGAERLQAALAAETTAATASALAGPQARLADPLLLRPRLRAPVHGLVVLGRPALDLLAGEIPAHGAALVTAVGAAASAHGLQHLLVPEVMVATAGTPEDPEDERERETPVSLAARAGERATRSLSVTVDLRCLRAPLGGTQVHALEAAAALARRGDTAVRVLLPHAVHPAAQATLGRLEDVERIDMGEIEALVARREPIPQTDVFHRPFQVTDPDDVDLGELLGHRFSVTHQDLIAYRVAAYHDREESWQAFRRLTRLALARADLVCFESEHARSDARADGIVEPHVAGLAPIGTDHRLFSEPATPRRPEGVEGDRAFLLCLGTDFAHKQRPFALRLTQALADRGWEGRIVLAGPRVANGGTAEEEAPLLAALGDRAADLGPVDEPEKAWLYDHAAAVVHPSAYEGFGLVPFEAAAHGTPVLFAPVASVGELLTGIDGGLVPWDPEASAERALALLAEPAAQVAAIAERARSLTWDAHAEHLMAGFGELVQRPKRPVLETALEALASEAARGRWEGMYWHLHNAAEPAGLELVGPDEPLLDPDERRTLAALLRRPVAARPLRRLLRMTGRTRAR